MCSQQFIRRRTTALESHHYRRRPVICDRLTIGDTPVCSIGMIDRQSWFPHSGAQRESSITWPIARLSRKKADQRAKLEASLQKTKTGGSGVDGSSSLFWTLRSLLAEHLGPSP
jgi:hypothetical protein